MFMIKYDVPKTLFSFKWPVPDVANGSLIYKGDPIKINSYLQAAV